MTACLCEQCRPDDPAPTWTVAYMRLCEARTVARMDVEQRKEFMRGVEKKRGATAADSLWEMAKAEYRRMKAHGTHRSD